MILSKKDILSVDDREYVEMEVTEWGGSIRIYVMSLRERMVLEGLVGKKAEKKNVKADKTSSEQEKIMYLLRICLKDKDGSNMFDENEVSMLLDKDSKVVYRIFEKCISVNNLGSANTGTASSN